MQDVSGFGFVININASNTFPAGYTVSQFADDADPMDIPELKTGEAKMGLNGDLIFWSSASPIDLKLAVVAGSEDDINLSILLEANRVGRGKSSARDVITATGVYPDGTTLSLTQGKIVAGSTGSSVSSNGRIKTKTFGFMFENRAGSGF